MKIEQKQTKAFQPISITLENEFEAEVVMHIMSHIAGDGEKSPRGVADTIFEHLLKLGVDYRDDAWNMKFASRGKLFFENHV